MQKKHWVVVALIISTIAWGLTPSTTRTFRSRWFSEHIQRLRDAFSSRTLELSAAPHLREEFSTLKKSFEKGTDAELERQFRENPAFARQATRIIHGVLDPKASPLESESKVRAKNDAELGKVLEKDLKDETEAYSNIKGKSVRRGVEEVLAKNKNGNREIPKRVLEVLEGKGDHSTTIRGAAREELVEFMTALTSELPTERGGTVRQERLPPHEARRLMEALENRLAISDSPAREISEMRDILSMRDGSARSLAIEAEAISGEKLLLEIGSRLQPPLTDLAQIREALKNMDPLRKIELVEAARVKQTEDMLRAMNEGRNPAQRIANHAFLRNVACNCPSAAPYLSAVLPRVAGAPQSPATCDVGTPGRQNTNYLSAWRERARQRGHSGIPDPSRN